MKKSLYVLSAAVLSLGVGAATIAATSPFAATSTDVAPVIEAEYEYNSTLDIPTYEKDGVTFQSVLVYPDGKATKIIIPSEIQGIAGLVKSVTEVGKDS